MEETLSADDSVVGVYSVMHLHRCCRDSAARTWQLVSSWSGIMGFSGVDDPGRDRCGPSRSLRVGGDATGAISHSARGNQNTEQVVVGTPLKHGYRCSACQCIMYSKKREKATILWWSKSFGRRDHEIHQGCFVGRRFPCLGRMTGWMLD